MTKVTALPATIDKDLMSEALQREAARRLQAAVSVYYELVSELANGHRATLHEFTAAFDTLGKMHVDSLLIFTFCGAFVSEEELAAEGR